jgi:ABC-2 type transport system ATP-binding protein
LPIASESPLRAAAHSREAALLVDNVSYRYGAHTVLDAVSLVVAAGELLALLGPNGGGKTTLFRIIATLRRPASGSVQVFGADTRREPAAVRRQLGVVFQSPALDARLTIRENLTHHGHLYGLRGRVLGARIDEMLALVGLTDRAGDIVLTLSGGLARRAEIAKALLPRPSLLLLDEPTTGLDPGIRETLWRDLRRLRESAGTTIVLTTHLMDEAAGCDRVALLDRGRLVLEGRPDDLTAQLGGDVITIETAAADPLARRITERFGLNAQVVDGVVRLEKDRAHELVGRLVEAFPAEIRSIRFSRPTLQDVFVHHTGHRFE